MNNSKIQFRADGALSVQVLLERADAATDMKTNGVLDRGDLQDLIRQLGAALRELSAESEQSKGEREVFARRLNRHSTIGFKPSAH